MVDFCFRRKGLIIWRQTMVWAYHENDMVHWGYSEAYPSEPYSYVVLPMSGRGDMTD
jgi:hypothetical protein